MIKVKKNSVKKQLAKKKMKTIKFLSKKKMANIKTALRYHEGYIFEMDDEWFVLRRDKPEKLTGTEFEDVSKLMSMSYPVYSCTNFDIKQINFSLVKLKD